MHFDCLHFSRALISKIERGNLTCTYEWTRMRAAKQKIQDQHKDQTCKCCSGIKRIVWNIKVFQITFRILDTFCGVNCQELNQSLTLYFINWQYKCRARSTDPNSRDTFFEWDLDYQKEEKGLWHILSISLKHWFEVNRVFFLDLG